ncbi:hypothetical protein DB88DRAFT_185921 [Papiliotrema laurentii]|jgi:hypothetical protein|uniref:Uncharacterized protein n=1 Tax=Papiliotrema laurentii TaxID=5418 RepID=A0AAD9FSA2_PAPLA|nr:hypothetical protein DB88DRAFT_185921 [Papiliotrema laurentii]
MPYRAPSSASIQLDPTCTGSTVRRAFLLEALLNLGSFPLVTHTRFCLSLLLNNPSDINPSSILFARLFGGIVVAVLTPALLCGYRNTRQGIESRRPVYIALGLGECALIPLLLGEAMKKGGRGAALSPLGALGAVSLLVPPLLWRIYVLYVKPEMLGRYTEVKDE